VFDKSALLRPQKRRGRASLKVRVPPRPKRAMPDQFSKNSSKRGSGDSARGVLDRSIRPMASCGPRKIAAKGELAQRNEVLPQTADCGIFGLEAGDDRSTGESRHLPAYATNM